MNAKGSTVAARLRNVPARVTEVIRYGAHEGTARAIAVISTMSRADYRQWEPIFPEWGARGVRPSRSSSMISTFLLTPSLVTLAWMGSSVTSSEQSQTRL